MCSSRKGRESTVFKTQIIVLIIIYSSVGVPPSVTLFCGFYYMLGILSKVSSYTDNLNHIGHLNTRLSPYCFYYLILLGNHECEDGLLLRSFQFLRIRNVNSFLGA